MHPPDSPEGLDESHRVRVRNLRKRFEESERYAAECSCGWMGEPRYGLNAQMMASRDGTAHSDNATMWRAP